MVLREAAGSMELVRPDGRLISSGPASLRLTDDRIEIQGPHGRPVLVRYVTIASLAVRAQAVEVLLESGHMLRLRDVPDTPGLVDTILDWRQEVLSERLILPGHDSVARATGSVTWSMNDRPRAADTAELTVDSRYLTVVPRRAAPFSVRLASLSNATHDAGRLCLTSEDVELRADLAGPGGSRLALAVMRLWADSAARLEAELGGLLARPVWSALATGRSLTRERVESLDSGAWEQVLRAFVSDQRWDAVRLLASLSKRDTRVGVACDTGRLVAWCLAPCESINRRTTVILEVVSEPAPVTVILDGSPTGSGQAGSGAPHLPEFLDLLDATAAAMGPDLAPLGATESRLAETDGGAWLWPMHHLEPLRVARRACRELVPHGDDEQWMRDTLGALARRDAAHRA